MSTSDGSCFPWMILSFILFITTTTIIIKTDVNKYENIKSPRMDVVLAKLSETSSMVIRYWVIGLEKARECVKAGVLLSDIVMENAREFVKAGVLLYDVVIRSWMIWLENAREFVKAGVLSSGLEDQASFYWLATENLATRVASTVSQGWKDVSRDSRSKTITKRSNVSMLLDKALSLPLLQQRKIGSLLGAAVADAAARPLHWIYDLTDLNSAVAEDPSRPEFLPESISPFYSLPTGDNSCYWDEAQSVLTALATNTGLFNLKDIYAQLRTDFGPSSSYSIEKREEYMKLWDEEKETEPIQGKWIHGGMIQFLRTGKGDPTIEETDGFCVSLAAVAEWAGRSELRGRMVELASTQSTWSTALRHAQVAAWIVELFLLGYKDAIQLVGKEVASEFPEIEKELELMESNKGMKHVEAVGLYRRPCYNPGSFMGAIHSFLTTETFQEAVRQTILAGGCNCSRAFFIGAMLGARDGLQGIPRSWIERTFSAESVLSLAIDIVK